MISIENISDLQETKEPQARMEGMVITNLPMYHIKVVQQFTSTEPCMYKMQLAPL